MLMEKTSGERRIELEGVALRSALKNYESLFIQLLDVDDGVRRTFGRTGVWGLLKLTTDQSFEDALLEFKPHFEELVASEVWIGTGSALWSVSASQAYQGGILVSDCLAYSAKLHGISKLGVTWKARSGYVYAFRAFSREEASSRLPVKLSLNDTEKGSFAFSILATPI
jgi:hypothetical protein